MVGPVGRHLLAGLMCDSVGENLYLVDRTVSATAVFGS